MNRISDIINANLEEKMIGWYMGQIYLGRHSSEEMKREYLFWVEALKRFQKLKRKERNEPPAGYRVNGSDYEGWNWYTINDCGTLRNTKEEAIRDAWEDLRFWVCDNHLDINLSKQDLRKKFRNVL